MNWKAVFILLCVGLCSCKDVFQFNPNEVRIDEEDKNLNAKNIALISTQQNKNSFQFIVIGDSQRFYEDLDDCVAAINKYEDVAFVLLNGDITDFGLNKEYKWINRELKKLSPPYIGVIGNHDMLANGRVIYNEMFGPENFSFDFSKNKFICLNTNSLEVGNNGSIPDLNWLQSQLTDLSSYNNVFVFSHVAPFHEQFDITMVKSYTDLLAGANKVRMSLHGHQHSYSTAKPYGDGIEYVTVSTIGKKSFALVTVKENSYSVEQVFF